LFCGRRRSFRPAPTQRECPRRLCLCDYRGDCQCRPRLWSWRLLRRAGPAHPDGRYFSRGVGAL